MRNNTNPFILERINQELFFSLQSAIVQENLEKYIEVVQTSHNNAIKFAVKIKRPRKSMTHFMLVKIFTILNKITKEINSLPTINNYVMSYSIIKLGDKQYIMFDVEETIPLPEIKENTVDEMYSILDKIFYNNESQLSHRLTCNCINCRLEKKYISDKDERYESNNTLDKIIEEVLNKVNDKSKDEVNREEVKDDESSTVIENDIKSILNKTVTFKKNAINLVDSKLAIFNFAIGSDWINKKYKVIFIDSVKDEWVLNLLEPVEKKMTGFKLTTSEIHEYLDVAEKPKEIHVKRIKTYTLTNNGTNDRTIDVGSIVLLKPDKLVELTLYGNDEDTDDLYVHKKSNLFIIKKMYLYNANTYLGITLTKYGNSDSRITMSGSVNEMFEAFDIVKFC